MMLKTTLTLLAFCLTCIATSSARPQLIQGHDAKQILMGILFGSLEHEIEMEKTCILESAETVGKLEEAIACVEQGTEESTKEGIELLGEAIHEAITVDLADCELASQDFDALAKMAKTMAHPLSFFFHAGVNIVINHVDIAAEVQTALRDWRATPPLDYDFGYNVGEAMKLVLVGTEVDQQREEVVLMK